MRLQAPVFAPPSDYSRVKVVNSFDELVTTRFENGVNALCWRRTLEGDFTEVVNVLGVTDGIVTVDDARLTALPVSAEGKAAVTILLEDQQRLRALGLSPVLDCIHGYPRDEEAGAVPTDVYSFHADSATVETDTYLCSYTEAASEGLRNHEARRWVDIAGTRAELLKLYGGKDDSDFVEFLRENCYDLHYAPIADAHPFSFGLGNLWRIAVDYPGSPVPPCVHRAPKTHPGQAPRLLLIS
jgi:hypothetical protein